MSLLILLVLVGFWFTVTTGRRRVHEANSSIAALAGVLLAAAGWSIAVLATIAMLRDDHYDACAYQQPWWDSGLMLFVPFLAIASLLCAYISPGGTRLRLALRTAASLLGIGLFGWMYWDFTRLFDFSCGFF